MINEHCWCSPLLWQTLGTAGLVSSPESTSLDDKVIEKDCMYNIENKITTGGGATYRGVWEVWTNLHWSWETCKHDRCEDLPNKMSRKKEDSRDDQIITADAPSAPKHYETRHVAVVADNLTSPQRCPTRWSTPPEHNHILVNCLAVFSIQEATV